jgi:hypothetical protein
LGAGYSGEGKSNFRAIYLDFSAVDFAPLFGKINTMNKDQTKQQFQNAVTDFIDVCPHCSAKAHLKLVFAESHQADNRDLIYYALFRCIPCKKLILQTFRFRQNEFDRNENLDAAGWQQKFPDEEITYASKFEGTVPRDALEDFAEGVICLHNKCPRAATAMFRRSLQSALLERGSNSKQDLMDQIKNASFLTQDIKDWAHNIRIFGNWGAHPQDDNLKEADEPVAKETQAFLEEFFNYVYVMSDRVAKARAAKQQKKDAE